MNLIVYLNDAFELLSIYKTEKVFQKQCLLHICKHVDVHRHSLYPSTDASRFTRFPEAVLAESSPNLAPPQAEAKSPRDDGLIAFECFQFTKSKSNEMISLTVLS